MTSTNTHGGVWIAYCTNTNPCGLRLWRVGAAKPIAVPDAYGAGDVAISAGPDGRLWVAWSNAKSYDVSMVRTNRADTAFGPIETYATPCSNWGELAASGGSFGRLALAMACPNKFNKSSEYVTQSMTALSVSPSRPVIKNSSSAEVTFKVIDVGDAVAGATIRVDGKTAKTGSSGTAAVSFPKGLKTGDCIVTVSAPNYYPAHGTLVVIS